MKKQILIIIGVVATSFLVGAMFDINILAVGSDGNPWDKVWVSISELQGRVSAVEEKQSQVKMVRFVESTESLVIGDIFVDVATFVWTPQNATDNIILSMTYYAEYTASGWPVNLMWIIEVNGISNYAHTKSEWAAPPPVVYKFTPAYSWEAREYSSTGISQGGIVPNQPSYTITFKASAGGGSAYFRNVSVIITVADGLPASI